MTVISARRAVDPLYGLTLGSFRRDEMFQQPQHFQRIVRSR